MDQEDNMKSKSAANGKDPELAALEDDYPLYQFQHGTDNSGDHEDPIPSELHIQFPESSSNVTYTKSTSG